MDIKNKRIVAITGCAAGIAHTFMAAEGLENAAKEAGAKIKVETHGTAGPDNVLTAKEIREADLVIIAADIAVDKTRFVGKVLYETDTHLAIADPPKLLEEAFEKASKYKQTLKSDSQADVRDTGTIPSGGGSVLKHIMYSLSWMVPLVIAGGLIMAIGNVFAMQAGWVTTTGLTYQGIIDPSAINKDTADGIYILSSNPHLTDGSWVQYYVDGNLDLWWRIPDLTAEVNVIQGGADLGSGTDWVTANGQSLFEWGKVWSFYGRDFFNVLFNGGHAALILIYPVIAAGIAYSIAGKITFAPAFLGGWLMNDGNFLGLSIDGTPFGTGFLGAIAVGFFVGYMAMYIKKIKVNRNFKGICDLMLWPTLMALAVVIVGRFIFGPPLGLITIWMYNGIIAIGDIPGGNLLLAAVVAGMICTDLGGPINKTALVAGTAIFLSSQQASMNPSEWNFVPGTATQAAISIPPLIAFTSVLVLPKYFTNQERTLGTNASVMGMVGITEGAIPFAVSKPGAFIPANIVGGMTSGMLVTAFGFQFYGGLGSPLAPILGYVPSAVVHNYILSAMVWIGCYAVGVGVGLLVLWALLAITFKGQKSRRLAGEIKAGSKEEINEIRKQLKITANESEASKLKAQISSIKLKAKNESSKKKTEVKNENIKATSEKNSKLNAEKTRWASELAKLKLALDKANASAKKDKEIENYKKEVQLIKEKFADEIKKIKLTKTLTSEDKRFQISNIKEKREKEIENASSVSAYINAKQNLSAARKNHNQIVNDINSDYVKTVS